MSQNVLHRQLGFGNQDLRQSFSYQLQPQFPFNCTPATSSQLNNTILHDHSMTQPLLQYQHLPERYLQAQDWRYQQALPREHRMTAATTPTSQSQPWCSSGNAFAWNNTLSMEPLIMPESDGVMSNDFAYEDMTASQNLVGKSEIEYNSGQASWMPSGGNGLYGGGMSINGSDLDTISSTSPKSFFSETVKSDMPTSSPRQARGEASPGTWSDFEAYPPLKQSTPKTTSGAYLDDAAPDIDVSGLPQHVLGINMPAVAMESEQRYVSNLSLNRSQHFGPEQPSLYKSSPGATPWYPPGYPSDVLGLSCSSQAPQVTSFGPQRNMFPTHGSNAPPYYNSSHNNIAVQDELHVPQRDSQALRKADDKILIEGKDVLGLTYKEIRKRMHMNVAESTLRGRYRSLTKPKGHRVRKPVWTQNDVALLREAVLQEINRIETTHSYGLNHDSKLGKVQWKKVAEYIDSKGGTYHFGNATCKKKWVEVEASR